eukprot:7546743-Pyramimonas_sp.AAC.1
MPRKNALHSGSHGALTDLILHMADSGDDKSVMGEAVPETPLAMKKKKPKPNVAATKSKAPCTFSLEVYPWYRAIVSSTPQSLAATGLQLCADRSIDKSVRPLHDYSSGAQMTRHVFRLSVAPVLQA